MATVKTNKGKVAPKNVEPLDDEVNFDFDLLGEIASHAPTAGNYVNYGRVWMDNLQTSSWDNELRKFIKVPYIGGQIEQGHTLEFQLHQEIEKKDGDNFTKTWYIQVKENGVGVKNRTDWGSVVKPSIIVVFKTLSAFFKAMSEAGSHCAIEDFNTGRTRKDNKGNVDEQGNPKEYDITAPKFIAVFKNKKECDAAKEARFAKDALPEGAVPVKVKKSFEAFVEACGGIEEALNNIENDEYEGFQIADVLKAAGYEIEE